MTSETTTTPAGAFPPRTTSSAAAPSSTDSTGSDTFPAHAPSPLMPVMAPRRRSQAVAIPAALLKPGMEMLKLSGKAGRRPKSRRLWLEVPVSLKEGSPGDVELGQRAMGNVRICWEKNWRGVGAYSRPPRVYGVAAETCQSESLKLTMLQAQRRRRQSVSRRSATCASARRAPRTAPRFTSRRASSRGG